MTTSTISRHHGTVKQWASKITCGIHTKLDNFSSGVTSCTVENRASLRAMPNNASKWPPDVLTKKLENNIIKDFAEQSSSTFAKDIRSVGNITPQFFLGVYFSISGIREYSLAKKAGGIFTAWLMKKNINEMFFFFC